MIRSEIILFTILVSAVGVVAGDGREEIENDIDQVLTHLHSRVELERIIEPVVKHGTNAVGLLIDRYRVEKPDAQVILASCLCKIPTEESLKFLNSILHQRENVRLLRLVIRRYPKEYEDRITGSLIDILSSRGQGSFDAAERFREIILRKPATAGEPVRALFDENMSDAGKREIRELLASVSGYAFDSLAESNDFWRSWWARNSRTSPVDWRIEAFLSDPLNGHRRMHALEGLGSLHDWKALPYLLQGLDDNSHEVRYYSVCSLKELLGQANEAYPFDKFRLEESQVIAELRQEIATIQSRTNRPPGSLEAAPH